MLSTGGLRLSLSEEFDPNELGKALFVYFEANKYGVSLGIDEESYLDNLQTILECPGISTFLWAGRLILLRDSDSSAEAIEAEIDLMKAMRSPK